MSELQLGVPDIHPSDPESVATALETARALLRNGDLYEALRFVRRAAERAEESGDDVRAVALARAAADLAPNITPAPTDAPGRDDEAVALAPYDDFNDQTIVDSPSTTLARQAVLTAVQITEMPPAFPELTVAPPTVPSPASSDSRPSRRHAVRVSVSAPDPAGALIVRFLPDGTAPGPGASEALLVALEPGIDFFDAS